MRTPRSRLIASLAATALASPSIACPVCDSDTGVEVRAGLFNGEFAITAAKVVLPFPVTLALLGALAAAAPSLVPRRPAADSEEPSDGEA